MGCASNVLAFHGAFQGHGFCLMRLRVLTGISSLDAGGLLRTKVSTGAWYITRETNTANRKRNKRLQSLKKKQAKTSLYAQAQRKFETIPESLVMLNDDDLLLYKANP